MKNTGFTLVEMLVVVLILGMLLSIALPQYTKAAEKAYAAEAISMLGNIAKAERTYEATRNTYTDDLRFLDMSFSNIVFNSASTFTLTNDRFQIAVREAKTNQFRAYARRKDSEDGYYLNLYIDAGGTPHLWCSANPIALGEGVPTEENTHKICGLISDGDPQGIIR